MKIECTDGFTFSMIGGLGSYSNIGTVEVGFPSTPEPLLETYKQNIDDFCDDPTECVYAYVPLTVIATVLNKHNNTNEQSKQ